MIKKLELVNFKNYEETEIEFSPLINIIWGDNGQGKTNLLEAIHVLAFTKSMRVNSETDLIKIDKDFAVVKGDTLEIRFSRTERRVMFNDGVKCLTAKEWLGLLPIVFFGPQELNIVRGEPGFRRRFFDMAICQYKTGYTHALSVYKRAREQKSRILREYSDKPSLLDMLPEFNEKMIQSGEIIIGERNIFVKKLADYANVYHSNISSSNEKLDIEYQTKENLRAEIEKAKDKEIKSGVCLVGPHRDEIVIYINGLNSKSYASQGQIRTAALSLKLSERDILDEKLNLTPIMLLDDVLSELDGKRQDYILNHQEKGQILITDCEESRLKSLYIGKIIHVKDGNIG
jgi:DNA replication and repair protein RecF